jgi:cytochrome b6-f complex iron-sulfur subunit
MKKSRLDPELMPRRDFLGLGAAYAASAALLVAFFGALRLPKAAVLPSSSKKFRISLPTTMVEGLPHIPSGRSVAVFQRGNEVYAMSTVCTHLGCLVKPSDEGFDCPCHGSKFGKDGSVIRGPAPKALPWLEVKHIGGNQFLVDEGKPVPAGSTVVV